MSAHGFRSRSDIRVMKATAVIQARMGSSRLYGKVLLTAAGKPFLQHQIERVQHSKLINEVIVATASSRRDNLIVGLCEKLNIPCFRGSEDDVLDRFYQCALKFRLEVIVRLTADDPLQEPEVMDEVIKAFLKNECDYASNTIRPTYPDGFDVEVFSVEALTEAWNNAKLPSEREHVTPYIKNHPERFRCVSVEDSVDRSGLYWALDNEKDYYFVRYIIENLYEIKPYFKYSHILDFLEKRPELREINKESVRDIGYIKSLEEDKMRYGISK